MDQVLAAVISAIAVIVGVIVGVNRTKYHRRNPLRRVENLKQAAEVMKGLESANHRLFVKKYMNEEAYQLALQVDRNNQRSDDYTRLGLGLAVLGVATLIGVWILGALGTSAEWDPALWAPLILGFLVSAAAIGCMFLSVVHGLKVPFREYRKNSDASGEGR